MSVSANYDGGITVRETLATGVEAATAPVVIHSGFNTSTTLNASSTVPATTSIERTLALSAGTLTVDLTSLTGTNGAAVDFTGLKVQMFKFKNPSTHSITFTFGASNGYLLLGTAWKMIIPAGAEVQGYIPDLAPDVDSSHKTIDVSGTGTDTFNIVLVAG